MKDKASSKGRIICGRENESESKKKKKKKRKEKEEKSQRIPQTLNWL